ncbi:MAG: double zinc ribbon domain-containing protein [Clostridiales bacterium]|nr:double zinc ribbon domain-containing protein [Clostridiales bacterium]
MNRFQVIISAFLPKRCVYCGAFVTGNRRVCSDCRSSLLRVKGEICLRCGRERNKCTCKNKSMYYDSLVAPFYYTGNVKRGVLNFKYHNSPRSAVEFAKEMYFCVNERYSGIDFDFIAGVPMKGGEEQRGYNQCFELCREISKRMNIEFKENAIVKIYETHAQHSLPFYMRKGNLCGAFDIPYPDEIKGKTVLLVDDISTSGETLNECAKMLWLSGAEKICCVSLALTEKGRKGGEMSAGR